MSLTLRFVTAPQAGARRAGSKRSPPEGEHGWHRAQWHRSAGADRQETERRAAGIYGAIVTAAILAAVGGQLPTAALVVPVVVTLLVYWVAEEYAEILGEQAEGGILPTWAPSAEPWPPPGRWSPRPTRPCSRCCWPGWPGRRLWWPQRRPGAATVLLVFHGWSAARSSQLRGWHLLLATVVAAGLGLVMILLKDLVLIHLH